MPPILVRTVLLAVACVDGHRSPDCGIRSKDNDTFLATVGDLPTLG